VIIRPYEPRDRAAVREICCDTADAGNPCESFFPDREVLADLVTRYYTDFAPSYNWVAEDAGQVVGYLTGALETHLPLRLLPATAFKALRRGLFWHPQFRHLLALNWGDWLRARRPVDLKDYPAHFHINLREVARGNHVGDQLVEKFFVQMLAAGVRGVHVNVSEANTGGRRFFERLGFQELGRQGRFRHPRSPEVLTQTILFGKSL
jgi:ribosomal protein S18 acetylase RimI-like enzyme